MADRLHLPLEQGVMESRAMLCCQFLPMFVLYLAACKFTVKRRRNMQTYLKTKPVWIQLLLFIGMAFGLFFIVTFIGTLVLSNVTGVGLLEVRDIDKWNPNDPRMIHFIRGLLLLQFLGLFLIPSLLFAYFSDPKPMSYLGLKQPQKNIYWILAIVAMFVAIPAVEYIGALNQKMNFGSQTQQWMKSMEEEAAKQIQFMLSKHTVGELFTNLIFISLFAGIGEEIFFRGILQRMFIRVFKNPWMGIVFTAAIFSAFHFQFFGFFPRLALGIVLGAIYWYSGSLWAAIIAHFIYDGSIIVLAYLNPSIVKNPDESMINSNMLAPTAIVSLVLTIGVIWFMKKNSSVSYTQVYRDDKPKELDKFSF
jgi:membrane protease YdiL (CAAX protease family)